MNSSNKLVNNLNTIDIEKFTLKEINNFKRKENINNWSFWNNWY